MADITKRAGDCDDECGEGGERGERGHRGHRGHRGEQGPPGPAGPGGPAISIVGLTEGPAAQLADEDIPAGFVIAVTGSVNRAIALSSSKIIYGCNEPALCIVCEEFQHRACCTYCIKGPFGDIILCCEDCCGVSVQPIGITSAHALKGDVVKYVSSGVLTLSTQEWDVSTGGSGGLVRGKPYYLSQTAPGRLTDLYPFTGTAVFLGTALSSTTLDVNIALGNTDGRTLLRKFPDTGPFSAAAYGFAGGIDLNGRSNQSWQLAASATLPGTPIYKNLVGGTNATGQQPASASAWLSSQVIGLTTPSDPLQPSDPTKLDGFISGGLFELTEDQWNAVWTASDPNRGVASGLLPGYPYYLSDVPGTFFLINKTGTPPVAPGNWLTKCFVALSTTTALLQIGDPRQVPMSTSAAFEAVVNGDISSVTAMTFDVSGLDLQIGDTLIIQYDHFDGLGIASAPTGWSVLVPEVSDGALNRKIQTFIRIVDGTEGSSVSMPIVGDWDAQPFGALYQYRGIGALLTSGSADWGSGAGVDNWPQLVMPQPNCMLMLFAFSDVSAPPVGVNQRDTQGGRLWGGDVLLTTQGTTSTYPTGNLSGGVALALLFAA